MVCPYLTESISVGPKWPPISSTMLSSLADIYGVVDSYHYRSTLVLSLSFFNKYPILPALVI